MTSWPTEGDRDVNHVPHIEGLVAGLDFLLWLLTGHIPHYRPAPIVRNDVASRAWTAPASRCLRTRSLAVSAPGSASPAHRDAATRLLAPSRIRSFPAGIGNATDALFFSPAANLKKTDNKEEPMTTTALERRRKALPTTKPTAAKTMHAAVVHDFERPLGTRRGSDARSPARARSSFASKLRASATPTSMPRTATGRSSQRHRSRQDTRAWASSSRSGQA